MTHRLVIGLIAAMTVASWAAPTLAIDDSSRAAARTLVNEGADYFKAGRFEEARRKFMDAYEVAKVPTVAVWAAHAHEKLGKLVAASELYEAALLMQPNELWIGNAQQQAQQQAQEALNALKPRIPTLKINLVGATASEVEVTIDNMKVPSALLAVERRVDPGSHLVTASRGGKSVSQTVTLAEAQQGSVTLNVPPATAPVPPLSAQPAPANTLPVPTGLETTSAPENTSTPGQRPLVASPAQQGTQTGAASKGEVASAQRTWGWIGVGFGIAGLTVGAGSGVYVAFKRTQLHNDGCSGNECPNSSFQSGVNEYNSGRTLSVAGFITGGICTAAGLTLLLANPTQESAPTVGLMVGPSAVSLKGGF